MQFLSLFTGIGGMDLGLERAGMRCVAQVELDPFCRRVLEKHWPDVWRHDDVRSFCRRLHDCEPENADGEFVCPLHGVDFAECACVGTDQFNDLLDERRQHVDLIVGGDPCQDNSNACRNAGALQQSLGGQFLRVVEQLRPRLVLRENPATVRRDAPWPWWRFREGLESLGYVVVPFRLRACCAGADFRRDRLFLLAELSGTERAGLEGDERPVVARADDGGHHTDAARPDRWSASPRVCRGADGIPNRVDRIKSLGNAVVPAVAQWIGERIMAAEAASLPAVSRKAG